MEPDLGSGSSGTSAKQGAECLLWELEMVRCLVIAEVQCLLMQDEARVGPGTANNKPDRSKLGKIGCTPSFYPHRSAAENPSYLGN